MWALIQKHRLASTPIRLFFKWKRSNLQKQPPEMLNKKSSLKHLAIFTGKHLSLFNKASFWILQLCNFNKKRLQRSCFLVNIAKFFKNSFFYKTLLVVASQNHNFLRSQYYYSELLLLVFTHFLLFLDSAITKDDKYVPGKVPLQKMTNTCLEK